MENKISQIMEEFGIREEAAREIVESIDPSAVKPGVTVMPCEVYSRSVGYFRPVSQWNNGKREEFRERKMMNINGTARRGC